MRRQWLHAWPRERAGRLLTVFGLLALLQSLELLGNADAIQGQLTTGVRTFTPREGFALHLVASVGILAGFTLLAWRGLAVPAALSGLLTWIPAFACFALRRPGWSPFLALNGYVPRPGVAALVLVGTFWIALLLAALFWRHRYRTWISSASS